MTSQAFGAHWDAEYWQYVDWTQAECDKFTWYGAGEVRLNRELGTLYYFRITECLRYKVNDNLDLEAHYSFLYDRPIGHEFFRTTSRIELEFNPHFDLSSQISYQGRNRLELLKQQHNPQIVPIYRHRSRLVRTLENSGKIKSVSVGNEIFIDLLTNEITQNRFVPILVTLSLGEKRTMDLFLQIRNFRSADLWRQSVAFGSSLRF
jgi:hypothetical protein